MSLPVSISGRAEADLMHQYRWYLENANAEVAERFLGAYDLTVGKLARQPGLGRARKFRAPELAGIQSFPVGGRFGVHLIFYRQSGDVLSIERVMHGARDLPRRLVEPPQD
jgi:plasmid stabilization system protein ParE